MVLLSSEDDPRVGTVLSERYRIDALIGEGGMGKVYSAEHVMMKKRLAVKVLHRELTSVPEVVARFEREAMAAANIEHPNVAAATDFGKLADGSVFLVLEFVQGRNLRDEIAEGPMAIERGLHIARQIAAGLGSAHAQGIVHRDLKPENVMLVQKGTDPNFVKVLDFGIAKVPIAEVPSPTARSDQPITKAGMVFGTPEYMAPEQALGQAVDGRADLYALGVILFELLSGVRPFISQSPVGILGQQLANPPPTFADRAQGICIPPAVEQVVHRLLARDREQRPKSAADVVAVLDQLLAPAAGRGGYRFTLADGSPSWLPSSPAATAPLLPNVTRADKPIEPSRSVARHETGDATEHASGGAQRGGFKPFAARLRALGDDLHASGGFRARLGALLRAVGPGAEELRERLPPRLRQSLRPVPTRALLVAGSLSAVVVGVLVLAVVAALLRALTGSRTETSQPGSAPANSAEVPSAAPGAPAFPAISPPAPVPALTAARSEIESATQLGPAALEALAERFPADPEPRIEAARAWVQKREYPNATASVKRALALDAEKRNDERVAAVLFQTAQARPSAEETFSLLTGPMAARGAEILWDLAAESAVKSQIRQRAGQWLRSKAFNQVASEPLKLAAALRTAKDCAAARALLPRARLEADERSLSQLEAWQKTSGCGKNQQQDCMPCLRQDRLLDETIQEIRARKP